MAEEQPLSQIEKDKELYKASLEAFFLNELEHDKLILTLSTASIGFFLAIFQGNTTISETMFISGVLALIFFALTVIIILAIFSFNKKQLLSIIKTTGRGEEVQELQFLDKIKYISFGLAIIVSVFFTLSLIFQSIHHKEEKSTGEKQSVIKVNKISSYNDLNESKSSINEVSSDSNNSQKKD